MSGPSLEWPLWSTALNVRLWSSRDDEFGVGSAPSAWQLRIGDRRISHLPVAIEPEKLLVSGESAVRPFRFARFGTVLRSMSRRQTRRARPIFVRPSKQCALTSEN